MSERTTPTNQDLVFLNGLRNKYQGVQFPQGSDGFSIVLGEIAAVFIWGVFDEPDWPTRVSDAVKWIKDKAKINEAEKRRREAADNEY